LNFKDSFIPNFSIVVLGVIFVYLQGFEYKNSLFSISDGSFGTTFFM